MPHDGADVPPGLGAGVGDLLGGGAWSVAPLGGSTGRTFLATRDDMRVVARVDASAAVLRRVAAIGAGPEVLADGRLGQRQLVVQRHVVGTDVTVAGLASSWRDVAALVGAYQTDPVLAHLAVPLNARAYAAELHDMTRALDLSLAADAARLADQAAALPPTQAVATHGDPNSSNFIRDARLLLVDWDDMRRADPMRDIGQLAWWYLAPRLWDDFIEASGVTRGEEARRRLFWWAAAESLHVALRLCPIDAEAAAGFVADFRAALAGEPNPRRAG